MKFITVHLQAKTSCQSGHTGQKYDFSQTRVIETEFDMPTGQQIELTYFEMVEDLDSAVRYATSSWMERQSLQEHQPGQKKSEAEL